MKVKIKSPKRFVFSIFVLICLVLLMYIVTSALSNSTIHFGFWGKSGYESSRNVQNFVVAGVDEEGYRTDLILFCQYDKVNNKINIMQIPRDTKVNTHRADKKINSAYGSEDKEKAMFKELESVTGLKADKCVIVSFKGFRELVDAIGGVEVNVPMRMYYTDPVQNLTIDLYPGNQLLDGKKAEMYMRFRKNNDGTGYAMGDIERIAAQRQLYENVAKKLLNGQTILKTPKLLSIIHKYVKTNFTIQEMISYLGRVKDFKLENISIFSLPGESEYDKGVSYFIPSKEKINQLVKEKFTVKEGRTIVQKDASPIKNRYIKIDIVDASSVDDDDVIDAIKEQLIGYGFNVLRTSKSERIKDHSEFIEHNAKGASKELLKIYGNIPVSNDEDSSAETDVTLYVGNDFGF